MQQRRLSQKQVVRKAAVESAGGIVASQSRVASQAGARLLAAGGNAVDAAIATALAVSVAEPWMSGLGGGGMMLIYSAKDNKVSAIDFGMRTAAGLDPADYPLQADGGADDDLFGWPLVEGGRNLAGGGSIAIPGQADGLRLALEGFASKSWAELITPAIDLAEEGLPLDWFSQAQITQYAGELAKDPASAAVFLRDGRAPGPVYVPTLLKNPALLDTLKMLKSLGPRGFYQGPLAATLVADLQAAGSRLTLADLAGYQAHWVTPRREDHNGCELFVLPELNGGPTLLMALAQLRAGGGLADHPDKDFFVRFSGAMREAFQYRLRLMGDCDEARMPSCTTHLSVVDGAGNMVSLTQTLLSAFGSKVMLPASGVLMNNGVSWFDPCPGRPNSLAPGKKTLSNYAPMIGMIGEKRFALGASGGRKIIPALAQMTAFLGDFGMRLEDAMHQPRVDVSGPDRVAVDPVQMPGDVVAALQDNYPVDLVRWGPLPNNFAVISAVLRQGGRNWGAADPYHGWAEAVSEEEMRRD
jgi:gamma-glutamyltranspeptidase/glutathione hydrolase|tara:strand:+ start:3647 stop:5227 length:1581 start_codon:yes stop_codon:yes gene_type:complete